MSTIRDVAKESGLSTGTISKALSTPDKVSRKSLARVEAAIKKLNYKPNMLSQKFRNKQSKIIIIMVPDITNLFFAQLISGIEQVVQAQGYEVLLGDTKDTSDMESKFIRMAETKLADGIINLRPYVASDSLLPREGIFSVNAGGCEDTPYPTVRIDNTGAAQQAVEYLISLGHKRIGVISGPEKNAHTIARFKGYRDALKNAGIKFDESLVVEGDYNLLSGINAALYFLNLKEMPSAVFCMSDHMAISAISGFTSHSLNVPQDISVIGFDDMNISRYINPRLTTISQPAQDMGKKSAQLLIEMIEGKVHKQLDYILPYSFIIRDSTGPCSTS